MLRRDFLDPASLAGDPFWAFARAMLRYRAQVLLSVAMVLTSALALGVGMMGIKPIMDAILGARKDLPTLARDLNQALTSRGGVLSSLTIPDSWIAVMPAGDPFAALAWIMAGLILLSILGALATFLHSYLSLTIVNRTVTAVRRRAFHAILRCSLRTVVETGTADAVSRIVKDSDTLAIGLNVLLSRTLLQAAKGMAGFAAAFWFDWRITAIALLAGPALYAIIRKLGKRIRRASGAAMHSQGEMLAAATESLQALRVVKAHDAEHFEAARFHRINKRVFAELNRVRTARAVASPLTETLSILLLCAMVLFAGRAILASRVEPTNFILAIISLAVAGASLKPLTGLVHDIQIASPAARRLRELIALTPEPGHERGLPRLPRHARSIELDSITVTYPGRTQPALLDLSLTIPHGRRVAIVGPNGSGKTTLLSLLIRLFDPDAGAVRIDGHDIRSVAVRSLRSQVGVVSQETVLFRGTIRANIAYGAFAADEAVVRAARQARAHDFISRLPLGYETPVAEQGLSLSGGQRQRIAIARALLRDPSILILDEATSMVDAESEAGIAEAAAEFARGRTCLIVAHRLSTVLTCDRIVVLDQGRLIDQGTHAELLQRCRVYQQLAQHQLLGGPRVGPANLEPVLEVKHT